MLSVIVAGFMPTYLTFALMLPICGVVSMTLMTGANSFIQMAVGDEMRGRVLALYYAVFMGGTPIGAPMLGWVAEVFGARWTLIGGGIMTVAGTARHRRLRRPAPGPGDDVVRALDAPSPAPRHHRQHPGRNGLTSFRPRSVRSDARFGERCAAPTAGGGEQARLRRRRGGYRPLRGSARGRRTGCSRSTNSTEWSERGTSEPTGT